MTATTPLGRVLRDEEGIRLEFVRTYDDPVEDEDASSASVAILDCAPPTRLEVQVPAPDGPWRLSVELQARGGSTVLVFTQRLAEPCDASSVGPGRHYYLDRLGAVVAGLTVPDRWDEYYPALSDAYALPG